MSRLLLRRGPLRLACFQRAVSQLIVKREAIRTAASLAAAARDTPGETTKMNLFTAINDAMSIAMRTDDTAIVFGEDVAFGGVFRCSQNMREEFGDDRVFNTPLSENGIAGFAIGYAATGGTAIGEIQFADYVRVSELACESTVRLVGFAGVSISKWQSVGFSRRYFEVRWQICKIFRPRSSNTSHRYVSTNFLYTYRAPCGAVGHGGHYHSQSPEAYLAHTPGITVCMPRSPRTAKGLLLSAIRSPDPVIFLEPKALYRASVEEVPVGDYGLPLQQAEVVQEGSDVSVVGWGGQMRVLESACRMAKEKHGISAELIDLQTIVPWDIATVEKSVRKTGKLIVSHEAPVTCGFGAEVAATIQERCFWNLEAPIQRVCGYDTPFPLVYEKYYIPDDLKNLEAILKVMEAANSSVNCHDSSYGAATKRSNQQQDRKSRRENSDGTEGTRHLSPRGQNVKK
eukprot:scaffold2767_cov177-Amphora_coffeaeformis.AAC.34